MRPVGIINQLAEKIASEGGRAMLVGGCVRDSILQLPIKDIDIEVYGLEPDKLREVLKEFGKVDEVGASFAVFKLDGDIDVSIPRREKKTGQGHKGFTVEGDPHMSFEEACSRRDFTINAIMKDPLTKQIIDPYGGELDLHAKSLRAVSGNTFQEDSLRVLRLVQFASRFNFSIEDKTFYMALETDLSDLPKERVWMEIEKLLMKSPDPSIGMADIQSLEIDKKLFPSFLTFPAQWDAMRQAPNFCGDLSYPEKLVVLLSIFAYGSELSLLDELGVTSVEGYPVKEKVSAILQNMPCEGLETEYEYHKLSQKVPMKLMSRVIYSFSTARKFAELFADVIEGLGIQEAPVEPIIKGRHLIELGMQPSKKMGEVLDEIYDMQISGMPQEALWLAARGAAEMTKEV